MAITMSTALCFGLSGTMFPTQDGKWADHMCEKMYGYICKKSASIKQVEGTHEETNPGCKRVSNV